MNWGSAKRSKESIVSPPPMEHVVSQDEALGRASQRPDLISSQIINIKVKVKVNVMVIAD